MIKKYVFGKPFETNAVIENFDECKDKIKEFSINETSSSFEFARQLDDDDIIYGLGENVRGINKRGWIYESYATDEGRHTETAKSLYAAHNFILFYCSSPFGVFVDAPFKVTFDLGYSKMDEAKIILHEKNFKIYIIYGENVNDIVKNFRKAIGKSYLAPFWSFGYMQSRWGYKSSDECRQVVKQFRENDVPIDALFLDLDYMNGCRVFTTNEKDFPDFPEFVSEMRQQDVRLVPIIDAAVKAEKGYEISDEGEKLGYFCKDENGNDYVGCVWPGYTYFPDYLNTEAGQWFASKYQYFTDMGIEGFWNDMNEPAIFFSKKMLEDLQTEIAERKDSPFDAGDYFNLRQKVNFLWDYKEIYHNVNGEKIRHDHVHNLYGYNMTKSASVGLEKIEPDKRFLLFSRSSYIGMHRYGGIWTGDNQAWWSHLLMFLQQLPSLNMCGFLYVGSDIGGFNSNTTEDLSLRWTALSVFVPLMRNHNGTERPQEWYNFIHKDWFKDIIKSRYRLLPYIYSEYLKAVHNYDMMFKPLSFVFPDDSYVTQVEDQLMLGENIMIAPVYTQNAKGRFVYLPEDMLMVKMFGDQIETEELDKGNVYVTVPYNCVLFFMRKGTLIPLYDSAVSTEKLIKNKIKVLCFTDEGDAEYEMYYDDGKTKSCEPKKLEILVENESAYCNSNDFQITVLAEYMNNIF